MYLRLRSHSVSSILNDQTENIISHKHTHNQSRLKVHRAKSGAGRYETALTSAKVLFTQLSKNTRDRMSSCTLNRKFQRSTMTAGIRQTVLVPKIRSISLGKRQKHSDNSCTIVDKSINAGTSNHSWQQSIYT